MMYRIADLSREYILVTDSQDVRAIANIVGITDMQGCSGLFVRLSKQGDGIEEVLGFEGIVPMLDKSATSLFQMRER